ncbi:MAG: hypothetical protein ACD_78C00228G0001 [uncultured bacterium (gcode 4)]|uniref:Uncharacterized protein n=1 Tax=uncultured bacterium (gcode 4) TaxID=1234023 RepID=K1XY15_9BACT|nr:MAG: hypothetical protein ACD_78C00228G0001 [uncultured bacterium (gcode 4)]
MRNGFIVSERRNGWWEKFSPFSPLAHMLDDFRHECFILFFGVLFIQNAIGFIAETDAAKQVWGIMTIEVIITVIARIARYPETNQ